jgi:class 3 adenylate cyclase/tetratricopeptide (TPR) repeat protein
MDPITDLKTDSSIAPPPPIEAYPKDSIRKIAVLFTDIVGSTRYFKEEGDVAGRKMLQRHQEIASRPIVEHGGIVIKTVGDSLMAYFSDPVEAVKAAIKIQQRFHNVNRTQDPDCSIFVRIGVHFGDGIIEEHDIFGSVVNLAAKIVPLAAKDEIVVSQHVWKEAKVLSTVRYEPLEAGARAKDLEELTLYRLRWDNNVHFDPTNTLLIFLIPLLNLAEPGFNEIFHRILSAFKNSPDRSIAACFPYERGAVWIVKEITAAIDLSRDILEAFTKLERSSGPLLPLQVLIDSGPYFRADRLVLDAFEIKWEEVTPGRIHISSSALRLIKDKNTVATIPAFDYERPRPLYRLALNDAVDSSVEDPLFMYRSTLVQGRNPQCFYCSSRSHTAADCPSKMYENLTQVLQRLGYFSFQSINRIFLSYLLDPQSALRQTTVQSTDRNLKGDPEKQIEDTRNLALPVFFELKSIVQLRFFRNIWGYYSENWEDFKTEYFGGDKGGQIWLALDLIRTSHLSKAESLLNGLMLEYPQDYRVFCATAFLYLEQNLFSKAEYSFERAMTYTKTKPQRILILFLLSRLLEIRGNFTGAEQKTEEILRILPSCSDARYQRIRYRFQRGDHKRAIAELTKLIHEQKEYFVKALIDPDLDGYRSTVDLRLLRMFEQMKEKAAQHLPRAEAEIARIKLLLGEEESIDSEIQSMWSQIKRSEPTDSYFGYLDIVRLSNAILYRCLNEITEWKKDIAGRIAGADKRCAQYTDYIQRFPYPVLTIGLRERLRKIKNEIRQIRETIEAEEVGRFRECHVETAALVRGMESIPASLKRLRFIHQTIYFLSSFFKTSLTLQTTNLVFGIVMLPVASHYLVVLFPEASEIRKDLWFYQKGFLLVGGIFSFLLAVVRPLRKILAKNS